MRGATLPPHPRNNQTDPHRAAGTNRRNPAAATSAAGPGKGRGAAATPRQRPQTRSNFTRGTDRPDQAPRQPAGPAGPGTRHTTTPAGTATNTPDPPAADDAHPQRAQQPTTAHPQTNGSRAHRNRPTPAGAGGAPQGTPPAPPAILGCFRRQLGSLIG